MDFAGKLSFLLILLCVLISLRISVRNDSAASASSEERKLSGNDFSFQSLSYGFYDESCPSAQQIVRATIEELYESNPNVAPAMLRLVFHDCFVQGCDASILLDRVEGKNDVSEKTAPPNQMIRGFDVIDIIKSRVEEACPGVVSCADIIVLAAREGVRLAGGPYYPVNTGRRDSTESFQNEAFKLPAPFHDISQILKAFASKGFDERETVALLGAHSVGRIRCKFFMNRLQNFSGSGEPDPAIDPQFLDHLRKTCKSSNNATLSEEGELEMQMDYQGPKIGFGTLYYQSLLQSKGILTSDQQLTANEQTFIYVTAFAGDNSMFKREFMLAMIKLSHVQVLTAPMGEIRLNCRKRN